MAGKKGSAKGSSTKDKGSSDDGNNPISAEATIDVNQLIDQVGSLFPKLISGAKVQLNFEIINASQYFTLSILKSWHWNGFTSTHGNPPPTSIGPNTITEFTLKSTNQELMGVHVWGLKSGNDLHWTQLVLGFRVIENNHALCYPTVVLAADVDFSTLAYDDYRSYAIDAYYSPSKSGWPHGVFQIIPNRDGKKISTDHFTDICGDKVFPIEHDAGVADGHSVKVYAQFFQRDVTEVNVWDLTVVMIDADGSPHDIKSFDGSKTYHISERLS
jgi:hypothetical protein